MSNKRLAEMAAPDGYPITEPHRCAHCAQQHDRRGPGQIGALCGFVAGLAAALVSVLIVTIIDPAGGELTVAPPADAHYCGAFGWADHNPHPAGTPAAGLPPVASLATRP
ncbi:hypothetical protein [Mycobacterium sp. 29Ha]|uniref:hypothetical protein n=1 Tax=Mycobacterium sp. 29Ha TaxID=2939268 RepID=UPI00293930E3|nr:hypothetical protein [Mycobacterium sp. 29Ha]MDV3133331.1 hypothetical protein [Mycobacterium sp. 29Ha]